MVLSQIFYCDLRPHDMAVGAWNGDVQDGPTVRCQDSLSGHGK